MKKNKKVKIFLLIALVLSLFAFCSCGQGAEGTAENAELAGSAGAGSAVTYEAADEAAEAQGGEAELSGSGEDGEAAEISEDGVYDSAEEVALYLATYGRLPGNYITKKEAQALGWSGGSLEEYAPGKCIGGDRFGNYEGLLPEKQGRSYRECDIDTLGKSGRGAKRLVFSNDGLIYYTEDHYGSFRPVYGEEE